MPSPGRKWEEFQAGVEGALETLSTALRILGAENLFLPLYSFDLTLIPSLSHFVLPLFCIPPLSSSGHPFFPPGL